MPLLGAIAGCHCSVLWWGEERVTTNFGGVGVVPLLGAIVVCFGGVDVVPLQGAIVVCYGGEGRVTTNFGGVVDVVPLLGAIAGCQSPFHILLLYSGPPIQLCFELLADVALFSSLITQKLVLAIWDLCRYNISTCMRRYGCKIVQLHGCVEVPASGCLVLLMLKRFYTKRMKKHGTVLAMLIFHFMMPR